MLTIGIVMKIPEILKFVPDQLKTKKMCKHAVKKLNFVIRYVLDQYKTQQVSDKESLENDGTLESVCSYHVTFAFQSESTLYNCLNVKEPLARSRREIFSCPLKKSTTM